MAFHTAPTSVEVGAEESVLRAVVVVSMEKAMETKATVVQTLAAAQGVRGRVAKIVEALLAVDSLRMDEKAGVLADVHRSMMEEAEKTEGVLVQVTAWLGAQDVQTHVVQFEAKPGHVLELAESLELVLRSVDPQLVVMLAQAELAQQERERG